MKRGWREGWSGGGVGGGGKGLDLHQRFCVVPFPLRWGGVECGDREDQSDVM